MEEEVIMQNNDSTKKCVDYETNHMEVLSNERLTRNVSLPYQSWNRQQLAIEIIRRSGIRFHTGFSGQTNANGRTVFQTLTDTSNGLNVRTRFSNVRPFLESNMLRSILHLNDVYGIFTINAISGQVHTDLQFDPHYRGFAYDLQLTETGNFTRANRINMLEELHRVGFITQVNRPNFPNLVLPGNGWNINTQYIGIRDNDIANRPGWFHIEIWGNTSTIASPRITTQPNNISRAIGQNAEFSVTATGTSRGYQWQWLNPSNGFWQPVTATGGAANINTRNFIQNNVQSNMNGWNYRVLVSNANGQIASNTITLNVNNQPNIPSTFRVSRTNTFVGTSPNGNQIGTIGIGGTFTRTGPMQIVSNWTWLQGRLSGTSINPNTIVWISASQLERNVGANAISCLINDPQRFGFTSVRNNPHGANIANFQGNAEFRPVGNTVNSGGFSWRLGTVIGSNLSQINGTTVWVASTQFATNSNSVCR